MRTLTLYDVQNILHANQDGRCAICRQSESAKANGRRKQLALDHDHVNGAVRGLLCQRCNMGLGHFGDDPELLERAVHYLDNALRYHPAPDQPPSWNGLHPTYVDPHWRPPLKHIAYRAAGQQLT